MSVLGPRVVGGDGPEMRSAFERVLRRIDRLFDRLRDERAGTLNEHDASDAAFDLLRGHKYVLLVTFRRNGEAMPSPVWIGIDGAGRGYVKTWQGAGKVKRIRRDPQVVLAPCTMRGKPTGPALRGRARILSEADWGHAEATLANAYGLGRFLSERLLPSPKEMAVYLELVPRGQPFSSPAEDVETE